MTFYRIIGFEILNRIYTFVQEQEENKKTCQPLGLLVTNHHLFAVNAGVHCLL